MRIGWDMTTARCQRTGTYRHMLAWLQALAATPGANQHHVYTYQDFYNQSKDVCPGALTWHVLGTWKQHLHLHREWYVALHRTALESEVDAWVSLWYPPVCWRKPSVTIVLDCVSCHHGSEFGRIGTFKAKFGQWVRSRSCGWLVTSHKTKCEITRFFTWPLERIAVVGIPPISTPILSHLPPLPQNLAQHPYAFYCSAISPRKNHLRLIQAWKKAFPEKNVRLVLAGPFLNTTNINTLQREIERAQHEGFLSYVGCISDAERDALYAHADFVVYPSLLEGFGIPILEAMQWHKPILTSANTAMEEVGGNAVLLANATSVDDLTEKLRQISSDPSLRAQLIAAASKRLALFSPEKIAADLNQAIESLTRLKCPSPCP